MRVTVSAGGTYLADAAGVLSVNAGNLLAGLTPASLTLPSAGGNGSFSVSALAAAPWSAVSDSPGWLTVNGTSSGAGDGSVLFVASPNTSTSARIGRIAVGGLSFTLTQAGMVCQPSLSATSVSLPATTASGDGSVTYSVQANTGAARSGSLSIAGQTFTISQAAAGGSTASCSVSLSIARKLMIAGASTKALMVSAPAGCGWTATSSDPTWLTATPASGSGGATVSLSATANPAATARSANLTIGGQAVAVTQAGNMGNGCLYAFGTDTVPSYPDSATAAHAGATGSVPVTAPGSCAWTAASNVPWITVTAGASASGNNTVKYSVAANPGGSRTGTLTIASMVFTIVQD